MGGEDSPSSGPICQYVKRTPVGKRYRTTDCVERNRLASGHTGVASGVNCFLFGKT